MMDFLSGKVTPKDGIAVAVILSVACILCALFYFFVYQAEVTKLAGIQKELGEIRTTLAKAREIEKNIEDLRAEAEKMELLVSLFEQRLPERREIPGLLRKFENLGSELGLRVELEAMPTTKDENKETIPYKVVTRGQFHQIASFINLLERDTRYLKISDIDIGAEENSVSVGQFTLSTFRFIQAASEESS